MAKINLRDYYPFYNADLFIDIPDEVAATLAEAERLERNYIRRMFWNKAQYSLDADDGIEHDALPSKQGRRVYAHYILGMSKTEISRAEGVSEKMCVNP